MEAHFCVLVGVALLSVFFSSSSSSFSSPPSSNTLLLKQGSHVRRSTPRAAECADSLLSVEGIVLEQRQTRDMKKYRAGYLDSVLYAGCLGGRARLEVSSF